MREYEAAISAAGYVLNVKGEIMKRRKLLSIILILSLVISMVFITTEISNAETLKKKTVVMKTIGGTYQQKLYTNSGKLIKASKVKWKSSNPKIAKVSKNGKITAISKGTTTIDAVYLGYVWSCRVVIKDAYFKSTYMEIAGAGMSKQLNLYNYTGKKIPNSKIKWSSSNSDEVSVSSNGIATSEKKGGYAKIRAKYNGKTYTCRVDVRYPISIGALSTSIRLDSVGSEKTIKISKSKACGDSLKPAYIEGSGVALAEIEKIESTEQYDRYQVKIKALKEGKAVIRIYIEGSNPELSKNYVDVDVKVGSEIESGKPTAALIQQITNRTIEVLRASLIDPSSLQVYNISTEWMESEQYLKVKINYGAKNGFGGMGRDNYYMFWKNVDGVNWRGQPFPF